MRIIHYLRIALFVIGAVLLLSGCSGESTITGENPALTKVQGSLQSYLCDPRFPSPYRTLADESATITFASNGEAVVITQCDDQSKFTASLAPRFYDVIIRHPYAYPPDTTYAVHVGTQDTTLELTTPILTLDPLIIVVGIDRGVESDPGANAKEWALIEELGNRTMTLLNKSASPLDISGSSPEDWQYTYDNGKMWYNLPINRKDSTGTELYNVVEVWSGMRQVIENDNGDLKSSGSYVELNVTYPCPF